ncbi:hypothetical protein C1H76_2054 [Elsinoe australis]|uniref:Uncharacterized protein n=1 Tax=Elsinoe australis TaxID=40998 RepID=A0A4U7B983_9PEZI|nr:hypothetical protein C1H76_2054 [Elsinoe australis]
MDVSGGAKCDESFRSAVDRLFGGEGSKQKLGAVLITGEEDKDEAMVALLRQVLRERFSNAEAVDVYRVRELAPDEAFAGSRAAALAKWQAKVRQREEDRRAAKGEL